MPLTVTQLTDRLMASYARAGGINHLDGKNLPSKRAIALHHAGFAPAAVPRLLRRKARPFLRDQGRDGRAAGDGSPTAWRMKSPRASNTARRRSCRERACARSRTRLTLEFLASLPRIRDLLQTDTEAAYNGDPAALSKEEVIVAYPFIEAIAVQRLAHELYLKNIPLIPRIMTEWAHSRTGMDLHPGAQIGSHFFVDHCTGTVIGETRHHRQPRQDVSRRGPGGEVPGRRPAAARPETPSHHRGPRHHLRRRHHHGRRTVVGEGSTIGANVFLTTSVPPHSLVVQEEANVKVMKKERPRPPADFHI